MTSEEMAWKKSWFALKHPQTNPLKISTPMFHITFHQDPLSIQGELQHGWGPYSKLKSESEPEAVQRESWMKLCDNGVNAQHNRLQSLQCREAPKKE